MPSLLKLPDVWRILREVDLEQIRRDADARFRLIVLSDDPTGAEELVRGLAGASGHPWLEVHETGSPVLEPSTATAALVLSSRPGLPAPLAQAARALRASAVPVVTVVRGSAQVTDAVVRDGETSRVAVASLAEGMETVAQALVASTPQGTRLALARQLPPLRRTVFSSLIEDTARANGAYAFSAGMAETVPVLNVPLNVADVVVLTKNQLLMGYKIALGSGKTGRPRELVGEILGVIGGGMLFRQAARSLVGLIPIAGLLPKVVIAYAGTWAIGQALAVWGTEGRRVSRGALIRLTREARGRGRLLARRLLATRQAPAAPPPA